jgi:hypothetical protein
MRTSDMRVLSMEITETLPVHSAVVCTFCPESSAVPTISGK